MPSAPMPTMVIQGGLAIAPNILILGGTTEATALAQAVAEAGLAGQVSFAGRVDRPKRQPLPQRVGGFGGADGLATFLAQQAITHVVDATHPFAARMSRNAVAACKVAGVPLVALTRPAWTPQVGDAWTRVSTIAEAAACLSGVGQNVLLAIGRIHIGAFADQAQHHYVLRLVDPPKERPPFPSHEVIVARGPFTMESDLAMMQARGIEVVVSKNSGGKGAYAKIAAAREMGIPVIMIDRPHIPQRTEVGRIADVLRWIDHSETDRGV